MTEQRETLAKASRTPAIFRRLCTRAARRAGDLPPLLLRAWRQSLGPAPDDLPGQCVPDLVEWLACWSAERAGLIRELSGDRQRVLARWLGLRLAWWSRSARQRRPVGVVSSRLGRALDLHRPWFAALRAVCREIDPSRDLLVSVRGTAPSRYVARCAAILDLPALVVDAPGDEQSLADWLRRLRTQPSSGESGSAPRILFSPPLAPLREGGEELGLAAAPARDRALVAISDRLVALYVRPRGWVARLIEARLADPSWPAASVWIATGRGLTQPDLVRRFLDRGAVAWRAPPPADRPCGDLRHAGDERSVGANAASIIDVPSAGDWRYLTHCTRRRDGPWPGESEQEYLDGLILDRASADHSPLAALTRMVRQQKLIASSQGVRGATPVVSFTEAPLADLPHLRVFRPHRSRWDFEPYGVCIRRDWLLRMGARPAIYGDDRTWVALSPAERPFFQLRGTRRSGRRPTDWTAEREWRCVGDVDLRTLPSDAGFVFAPRQAEASRLAELGRWPAAVLDP